MGKFNGITSFEAPSSTSGQTQDGYPGGDLQNLVVDQTGTVIGVFTNGRSYSLAQVALAKFTNNEGLMSEGGTLFSASPNSGEPIIGTAGTGGRGTIQPSALEMSNVDLSRSLTQLIVIQRGFQANSKTITTSDQMLNTLLQLKQ
jgi:flagellar hook protein FlgE